MPDIVYRREIMVYNLFLPQQELSSACKKRIIVNLQEKYLSLSFLPNFAQAKYGHLSLRKRLHRDKLGLFVGTKEWIKRMKLNNEYFIRFRKS